ncbi:MAG TPA: hypothetical protein P5155_03470, partial [Candidatus Absconditabacterales bacterium]|nr:hypothetical protein [Candidatus Absconditabacterales bacterium]
VDRFMCFGPSLSKFNWLENWIINLIFSVEIEGKLKFVKLEVKSSPRLAGGTSLTIKGGNVETPLSGVNDKTKTM